MKLLVAMGLVTEMLILAAIIADGVSVAELLSVLAVVMGWNTLVLLMAKGASLD